MEKIKSAPTALDAVPEIVQKKSQSQVRLILRPS